MRFAFAIFVLVFFGYGCSFDLRQGEHYSHHKTIFIEHSSEMDTKITIPFQKFYLENGLTVILHTDNSDPIVHVNVSYHVGSAREELGKTGNAHLLEHILFEGSQNVPPGLHSKIVLESGGTSNGGTNEDRTRYFQTVPSDHLARVLWLEADRMGFIVPEITKSKLDTQRKIVLNELNQRLNLRPYGRLNPRMAEALYAEGHPYSWIVGGDEADIKNTNVHDLKQFHLRWYSPNNAVLTIAGDIDVKLTLELVRKYFGDIPRGPKVVNSLPNIPIMEKDRYIYIEDNVPYPLLNIRYPTVFEGHPDQPSLDIFADLFAGGGQNSILTNALVDKGIAVQADASHQCRELACTFNIGILIDPKWEGTIEEILTLLADNFLVTLQNATQNRIQRTKAIFESSLAFDMQTIRARARKLSFYELFWGTPNGFTDYIRRYNDVTYDDLKNIYNVYFNKKPKLIGVIAPSDHKYLNERKTKTYSPKKSAKLPHTRPILPLRNLVKDDVDRSAVPPTGRRSQITFPKFFRMQVDEHIDLLVSVNSETPTTSLSIRINAGQRKESIEMLGIASLTASLITEHFNNSDCSSGLDSVGSSIKLRTNNYHAVFEIRSLTKYLDRTIEAFILCLEGLKFKNDDLSRLKKDKINKLVLLNSQASVLADSLFERVIFGDSNSFAHADEGTVDTLSNITLNDVINFYEKYYRNTPLEIGAITDLSPVNLSTKIKPLSQWYASRTPQHYDSQGLKPFPALEADKVYFYNIDGASQAEIRVGTRAFPFDLTGDFFKLKLANFSLGRTAKSRMNVRLRQEKGYSYTAKSYVVGDEEFGSFFVATTVGKNVVGGTISEIFDIIEGFAENGPNSEEVEFTKEGYGRSNFVKNEQHNNTISIINNIFTYDFNKAALEKQNFIVQNYSKAQGVSIMQRVLNNNSMIILIIGDKQSILPQLESFGREIVFLN